jgi:hypothetical protein
VLKNHALFVYEEKEHVFVAASSYFSFSRVAGGGVCGVFNMDDRVVVPQPSFIKRNNAVYKRVNF